MTGAWSRSALIAVIGVVGASLVVAVVLTVLGDDLGDQRSAGVDGYSVSAIGHRGLVQLLDQLGVPVVVSRSDSAARASHGLLIVAEPTVTDDASRARLAALVDAAPRALVVLPKWYGSVERGKRWIDDANPLPESDITAVLEALDLDHITVHRAIAPVIGLAWQGLRPVIREPQLVAGEALTAVVAGPGGDRLLGKRKRDGRELYVLSDPDVLNNVGLRDPENAQFAVQLIDDLRDGGPVVIDETMHGYARTPSLVRALIRFPLVIATLQVLVCAVLVVWAAMVRFGPRRAAPPPIASGKDFLIWNTAALLHHGGHHTHALRRYLALSVAAVRHALHAPALPPDAMTAWLERVRRARGGRISLTGLECDVEIAATPARVVDVADAVYRWRKDMTDGADERS